MDPLLFITKVSLVHQEGKQQEIQSLSMLVPDAAALTAKSATRGNNFSLGNSTSRKSRFHCDQCGRDNHNKNHCFKLIGYPPNKVDAPAKGSKSKDTPMVTPPKVTQEQYNKLLTMLASGNLDPSVPNANLAGIALTITTNSI